MRLHSNILCLIISLTAVLVLGGCAELVVKEVDYKESLIVPESAHPAPIKFTNIRFLLPPGTEIGMESGMGPALLGGFCSWSNYPVSRNVFKHKVEKQFARDIFSDALEANGYDVVENIEIDFRPEDEEQRAEYLISARVKDIDLDVCHRGAETKIFKPIFDPKPGVKGRFYMLVDWSIYDVLRRQVVYKTSTEGYTKRDYPNIEGMDLMFYDAFEMAAHNLGADEDFYDLIVKGKTPPKHWRKDAPFIRKFENTPRIYDSMEKINIKPRPLSRQPVPKHIDEIRNATVMLQKSGHGSGFFITEDGHIVTNQNVVGDGRRIRVVTRGKKHKLIAEVLRVDKVRDVALLKLEKIPDNLKITPLPIRTDKLVISEDVYAIGTPLDYKLLQGTVSKGIVSAHRLYKNDGVRLPYVQADVETHGGNNGGPLIDEYGNIVGIASEGLFLDKIDRGTGLNLFIPIAAALRSLEISLDEQEPPAYPISLGEQEESDPNEASEVPASYFEDEDEDKDQDEE
jgi:S1-C subfamily serine protease